MSANLTKLYLFKRSNGFYYILFEEEGRRRWKSTRCTFKADALKVLTQFDELLKTKPKTANLPQFTNDFLEFAKVNYTKPTVDIATIALNHLKTVAGECMLTSLTAQHLDRYKAKRLTDGVSPVTVNVELRALRSIMNVALRWKLLESNPFAGLQLIRVPDVPPAYLSKQDLEKLLNLVNESWLRETILFAVLTGMRRGEIVNLRWQDVDLSRKLVFIQSNPTFKTKQGKRRTIPLSDVAYQMLSAKANHSGNEHVFTANGRGIAESWLTHRFKHYVRKSGLPKGLHFHSLRHTFASWLAMDGVSLYAIQKLLGHSSSTVTQMYSHLQPEELHHTVNKLKIALN
jgi:integrase